MNFNTQLFRLDSLSSFVGIFICFFSLLTVIYSIGFMKGRENLFRYYAYIILTSLASLGAVFSNDLILFIVCWGFSGLTLYLLINFGRKKSTPDTAKKAFIIVGGADALMLLGLGLLLKIAGTSQMDKISIALNSKPAVLAYLCLACGAFAKAGAMPFHTWVPDTAEDAPTPVTAFLPASLDKLLGIYLLARISLDIFQLDTAMRTFLMAVGSFTIVAAVMMALIQHDMKKLLGYHAVSQVGYMVLGIGTGVPIGIAGGLFHMLNNAIYKSCLFFSAGSVEKKAGTTDLDKLGSLAKFMPITFICFLIASFAISGVPPFNGFVSKWMIYQGIIETAKGGGWLWVLWLVAALFGSALTLASFMKLIHAVFLGQPSKEEQVKSVKTKEVGPSMWIPTIILASLCIVFGVFAYKIPITYYIAPSVPGNLTFTGIWDSGLAAGLMLLAMVIGFIIYLIGTVSKSRETEIFMGGETLKECPHMRVSGTEFYKTVQDIGILKLIYSMAKKKMFDIYEVGAKIAFAFNAMLKFIHNGVLPTYLSWCLLGMIVLFYILLK
ncbi:MAG: proton-conducting transporter membrane subunit [Candidatus Omnitrophota bacterium]